MNQNKRFLFVSGIFFVFAVLFVAVLSYYILENAQWTISDDAIIINKTGWGIPFSIWDTINVNLGRCFPLAYMHENLVLFFSSGMHEAYEHYAVNVFLLVTLSAALYVILHQTIQPKKTLDLVIIFFALILCVSRFYAIYINLFSTLYNYYTVCSIGLCLTLLFYRHNKSIYAIFSLVCWLYSVFCLESAFVLPLSLGIITLLFGYKQLSVSQKYFNIGLIIVAFLFLGIYFFGIYVQKEGTTSYDSTHGTGISFLQNAINIIKGQKFLLCAALVWGYRQFILFRKKDIYHIVYDSLLWSAGAVLVAGLTLRLNWSMYYYPAILVALPAVIFFIYRHFGKITAFVVVVFFAFLHSYKIPNTIELSQQQRTNDHAFVVEIVENIQNGNIINWYEVETDDKESYFLIQRDWKKQALRKYIQFELKDRDWDYTACDNNDNCVVLYPEENYLLGINISIVLPKNPDLKVAGISMYKLNQ